MKKQENINRFTVGQVYSGKSCADFTLHYRVVKRTDVNVWFQWTSSGKDVGKPQRRKVRVETASSCETASLDVLLSADC